MAEKWSAEFYRDVHGRLPVRDWMEALGPQQFAALSAAILHVLEPNGLSLARTQWLKPLKQGLYEFRIRHSEREILAAYAEADASGPEAPPARILLRVFVAFRGAKVILLISGYDKGRDPSARRQQKEIANARKALRAWEIERAAAKKHRGTQR
ncbi:hypothetical protein NODU109028_21515 [Nocardioides dubius]|uniref:Type II toxin-antitoxin system RelE/ParE family toxin n=1 Tax=Nocardioides dubius TaxID=317019 RepID=A0ABN1TSL3_9ACTN